MLLLIELWYEIPDVGSSGPRSLGPPKVAEIWDCGTANLDRVIRPGQKIANTTRYMLRLSQRIAGDVDLQLIDFEVSGRDVAEALRSAAQGAPIDCTLKCMIW